MTAMNKAAAAEAMQPIGGDPELPTLKAGDLVGFCYTPREVVPANIVKVYPDARNHLKATIIIMERYKNRNPDSMDIYLKRAVATERLYQRTRQFDPPVQAPDPTVRIEQFTTSHTAKEPGGPLTSGTWFDLRPWVVSIVSTLFEVKDKHGMVEVPGEVRTIGDYDGSAYMKAYQDFDRERREGGWDRIDITWRLKESL